MCFFKTPKIEAPAARQQARQPNPAESMGRADDANRRRFLMSAMTLPGGGAASTTMGAKTALGV